jgi:translocation and assembly module TamB
MARAARLWRIAAGLLALPLAAGLALLLALNTAAGRAALERGVPRWSAGYARIEGLGGRFPDALRLRRLELRDAQGPWLLLENLRLDAALWHLARGELTLENLEAGHILILRPPLYPPPSKAQPPRLPPVSIRLGRMRVAQLELAAAFIGQSASLSLEGGAALENPAQGQARFSMQRLDAPGAYRFEGRIMDEAWHVHLHIEEPPQGLLAYGAKLPELGALQLEAALEGPPSDLRLQFSLNAGELGAKAAGALDWRGQRGHLSLSAQAPAMQPSPDLAWRGIACNATAQGAFLSPEIAGDLRIEGLHALADIRQMQAHLQGNAGQVQLSGQIEGIQLPGPKFKGLLAAAPLQLTASLRLDTPKRPLSFAAQHPLFRLQGQADTSAEAQGKIDLSLPEVASIAAGAGLSLGGAAQFQLRAKAREHALQLELDGSLQAQGKAANWLGETATLNAAATATAQGFALSRLQAQGKAVKLSAWGALKDKVLGFEWQGGISDLRALAPDLSGAFKASGSIKGAQDNFQFSAEAEGKLGAGELAPMPLTAQFQAQGLPRKPLGRLTASLPWLGSPIALAVGLRPEAESVVQILLERATWKSAQASGSFSVVPGAPIPIGKLQAKIGKLQDFSPSLGQAWAGAAEATLELAASEGKPLALLQAAASNVGLPGLAQCQQAKLKAKLRDPLGQRPVLESVLNLEQLSAAGYTGAAQLNLQGPLEALEARLAAAAANAKLESAALLDARGRKLSVSKLQLSAQGETLRLIAPARLAFDQGVSLEGARLGWRRAELQASGRIAPALDLGLQLQAQAEDLAGLFWPESFGCAQCERQQPASPAPLPQGEGRGGELAKPPLRLDGSLEAHAHLRGTPAHPLGQLTLAAQNLRFRQGAAQALPAAALNLDADVQGDAAQIKGKLSAGPNFAAALIGSVALNPAGPLDLKLSGAGDLSLLDPLLTAAGRRARGKLSLEGTLAGTVKAPQIKGTAQLAQGEAQDYGLGARIEDINALLRLENGQLHIEQCAARAGAGHIELSGVLAQDAPLHLRLQARQAQILSSDRLAVNLNADLSLSQAGQQPLSIAGKVRVNRAELRLPERAPARVAVLDARVPGAPPPPPPKPAPKLGLEVSISAPGEIFLRGRGLDAELEGRVQLRGSLEDPKPEGVFTLRRGQFTLAGQTLIFNKGEVGLNGGKLTDPSLDFTATTTRGNVSASLALTGTASKPKIVLSGEPALPQDEVLAQLLFGRNASSLGPLELAQIGAALASLTGVTSGIGDSLDRVRQGLSLDRLSVSSDKTGAKLEGGRYIAPGVYLGAQQGLSGAQTQGKVQVDISRHLKLEGSLGAAAATSTHSAAGSVGIRYEYEY